MRPVAVLAIGGESALGSGYRAFGVGEVGDSAITAIAEDALLRNAGLKKPFLARARVDTPPALDPARALLGRAARGLADGLDARLPGWRSRTIGWAVGTSSGGMHQLTEALRNKARGEPIPRELARGAPYFAPLEELEIVFPGARERVQVLAACASSAISLGLGCRWLEMGVVDLVVAGGYDAVTTFVASGFESLGATSSDRPQPFRVDRDGMALGEAAVLFALARAEDVDGEVLGYLRGFAATSDATHVTAPDREGAGLARAARGALADAGVDASEIDLVSAHATATPFNDAAEARALATGFGERLGDVVVHPFKAVVGHTLGASASLELGAALVAMGRGMLPAAAGRGSVLPECPLRLLSLNERGQSKACLKLSAAFGGANAALVAARHGSAGSPLVAAGVDVISIGDPVVRFDPGELERTAQIPSVHLARLDPLSGLAIAAAERALSQTGALPRDRTGVVVGTSAATFENNEAFDRKLRERGPRGVEPRRFPATSPNLAAGQVSIAFGLRGPSLSVASGLSAGLEALSVARDLIAAGDADSIVVIAAEDVGEAVRSIWTAAEWTLPAHGALAVVLGRASSDGLPRSFLAAVRSDAERNFGALGPVEPGWPSLRAALERRPRQG